MTSPTHRLTDLRCLPIPCVPTHGETGCSSETRPPPRVTKSYTRAPEAVCLPAPAVFSQSPPTEIRSESSVAPGSSIRISVAPGFVPERGGVQQFPQLPPLRQVFVHQRGEAFGVCRSSR